MTPVPWRFCVACGTTLVQPPDLALKPACPACGWFHPTYALPVVLVLAHTSDRRVVFARNSDWPAGAWALVAGFIEVGETAEAAALRELKEETGLAGREAKVRRTLTRDDRLLLCVEVVIDGVPVALSEVDEVLLAAADPALIPAGWQAREFIESYLRGWA